MKRVQKDIPLADLMPQVIRTRIGRRYWDFYQLSTSWTKIAGEHVAAQARPAWIKKDTLWLHVNSPVWSQEIQLIKPELLVRIKEHFPRAGIRDIRCLHEPAATRNDTRLTATQLSASPAPEEENRILGLTRSLPDAKAGRALHAFWKKINGLDG
jgi:hypothetical protein